MIDQDEIDGLAALYALGALAPSERRMVQHRMNREPGLADAVSMWERQLAPLSLREPGLKPPSHALEGILAALAQQSVSQPTVRTSRPLMAQHAWLGIATTVMAAVLAIVAVGIGAIWIERERSRNPTMTAVLSMQNRNPVADEPQAGRGATFLAVFDHRTKQLRVRQTNGDSLRNDRVQVLWLTDNDKREFIHLGRLDRNGQATLHLSDHIALQLLKSKLHMTLESEAAGEKPRGPLIAAGSFTFDP